MSTDPPSLFGYCRFLSLVIVVFYIIHFSFTAAWKAVLMYVWHLHELLCVHECESEEDWDAPFTVSFTWHRCSDT